VSRPRLRRWFWGAMGVLGATLVAAIALVAITLAALRPAPGDWQQRVRLGPIDRDVSVAAAIRMLTHPLAAPLVDGRSIELAGARWKIAARGTLITATCAPCALRVPALGPVPLVLDAARLDVHALGADRYAGTLRLGRAPQDVALPWQAALTSKALTLNLQLAPTPIAQLVPVFGRDLPERDRVQVQGSATFVLNATWPGGTIRIRPQLDGFAVSGLGTEQLLHLELPIACRSGSAADDGMPVSGWLPRAVVAAEDQRFFEHPGYDLGEIAEALQRNQRNDRPPRGASTITQQLAKRVVAGDERSASRKLRELLYAVEMERTLGKARILQLYLDLAPWGNGICGAERAARIYLRKGASELGPVSSAWLASLLTNPDAQLRQLAATGEVDVERVGRILEGMRPMSAARREKALATLPFWSPAIGPAPAVLAREAVYPNPAP
jgi:hypothetical protein